MTDRTPPSIRLNGANQPPAMPPQQPDAQTFGAEMADTSRPTPARADTTYSKFSMMSVPPEGSILTGKQEHCVWERALEKSDRY